MDYSGCSFACESESALTAGRAKATQLYDAIKRLQSRRKYLQLNSVEVKSNVHTTTSKLLDALRSREVWLLNQTDVVFQAKEEVLRVQEEKLNRAVGALSSCMQLVELGRVSEQDLLHRLHEIDSLDLFPQESPYITFRTDGIDLRDTIQSFGRIDKKGLPLKSFIDGFGNNGEGVSMPRKLEEYGDDEHQILYKTLSENSSKSELNFTLRQLPRVSGLVTSKELGLLPPSEDDSLSQSGKSLSGRLPEKLEPAVGQSMKCSLSASVLDALTKDKKGISTNSSSVRQWLNDIHIEGGHGEEFPAEFRIGELMKRNDKGSSEVTSTSDNLFGRSNTNKQGTTDMESNQICQFEVFRKVCQRPISDWLKTACAFVDQKTADLETKRNLRLTLAAFHKVINSPIQNWVRSEPGDSNAGDSHKYSKNETTSESTTTKSCQVVSSPISHYLQRINQINYTFWLSQSTASVLDNTKMYVSRLEDGSSPALVPSSEIAINPIGGYLRRLTAYPSSYWLIASLPRQSAEEPAHTPPVKLNPANYNLLRSKSVQVLFGSQVKTLSKQNFSIFSAATGSVRFSFTKGVFCFSEEVPEGSHVGPTWLLASSEKRFSSDNVSSLGLPSNTESEMDENVSEKSWQVVSNEHDSKGSLKDISFEFLKVVNEKPLSHWLCDQSGKHC